MFAFAKGGDAAIETISRRAPRAPAPNEGR
jgi:hypothetical protein